MPSIRDANQLTARLQDVPIPAVPLHGGLDNRQQDAAVTPGEQRVVVATAVAESSLTVPGVRIVIDSCLSREPRFDQNRGVSGLVTIRASQASAIQRAGRAAREGPGLAIRCVAADDWAGLRPDLTPEVLHADLTNAVLALACWGAPRGQGLSLPTPLPDGGLRRAEAELTQLALIDDDGRATPLGRRVAEIPAEPRLAAALLNCAEHIGSARAAEIVAMLSSDGAASEDLAHQLRELRASRPHTWRNETARLQRLLPAYHQSDLDDEAAIALVVATARPGWISRHRADGTYLSASGTGFTLTRGSRLGGDWLAVWETQRGTGADSLIRAAVPISEELALRAGEQLLSHSTQATWSDGKVRARELRQLGAITLSATPTAASREDAETAIRQAIAAEGLATVAPWQGPADELRRRLAVAHRSLGDPWPDVSDGALLERLDEWLAPEISALADGRPADLVAALRRLIPWSEAGRLDEIVPERIRVPSGSNFKLRYPPVGSDEPVVLAVKLQECFTLTKTPTIAQGREPVLLHLLSPAQRPLAVTDDLANFWEQVYPQVRAENRGRYAKHPWPDDPLTAPAKRGTNRQAF